MYNRMLIYDPKPKGVIKESTTRLTDNNYKKSYNFRIEGYTDSDNNSLGECRNLCGDLYDLKYGKDLNSLSSMSTNSLSVGGLFVTLNKKTGVLSVSGTTTKTHSAYGGNYLYITALLRRAIKGSYLDEETGGIQIKQFIEGSMSPDYVTENAVESVRYGIATGMRSRYRNGQKSAEFAFGYNTNKNYLGKYGNGYSLGFIVREVMYQIPLFQYTTIGSTTTFNDEKVTYTSFKIKPFITINPKGFPSDYKPFSFSGNLTATSLCGNARLKKLEGKTVKFNQLLNKANYPATQTKDGLTFANDNDGAILVNGTANKEITTVIEGNLSLISAHKYLLKGCPQNGSRSTYRLQITDYPVINDFGFDRGIGIIVNIATTQNYAVRFLIRNGYTADNLIFKPQLFDLTAMGLDSITTVAEFNSLFPNELYQYANSAFSSSITSLSSKLNGSIKDKINIGLTLNGLGNVRDTWEEDVLTKKIGKVDLGTLTWQYSSTYGCMTSESIEKGVSDSSMLSSINYVYKWADNTYQIIQIGDTSNPIGFTDPTVFKTAMNGVYLYYELATPTVEDKPLNTDFLLLENGSVKIDGNDYDSFGANLRATISFDNDPNESQTEEVFTSVEYTPQGEIYVASNKFREIGISSYPLRRISDTIFDYRDYLTQYNKVGIGRLSLFDFTYEDGLFKVPLPYGKLGGALKFKSNSFVQTDFADSNMNTGIAEIGGTVTNRMLIIKASQTSVSDFKEAVGTDVVLYELSSTDEIDLSITRIPLLIPNTTTRISDDTFIKSIDSISYCSNEMPANYETYIFVNSDVWTIDDIDGYDYLKVAVPDGSTEMDTNVWIYNIDNNGQENLVFGQDSMFPPHIENSYLYVKVGPVGTISQSDIPEFTSLLISVNAYVKYEKEE